jgi:hypothetical protein
MRLQEFMADSAFIIGNNRKIAYRVSSYIFKDWTVEVRRTNDEHKLAGIVYRMSGVWGDFS